MFIIFLYLYLLSKIMNKTFTSPPPSNESVILRQISNQDEPISSINSLAIAEALRLENYPLYMSILDSCNLLDNNTKFQDELFNITVDDIRNKMSNSFLQDNFTRTKSFAIMKRIEDKWNKESSMPKNFFFLCKLCYDSECEIDGSYLLDCGHRWCCECFTNYVIHQIKNNSVGEDVLICPDSSCKFPIDRNQIADVTKYSKTIKQGMDIWKQFETLTTDSLIDKNVLDGSMIRCPTNGCTNVMERTNIGNNPFVFHCKFGCELQYCFNCQVDPT